jgi:hypothetical protein
VNKLCSKKCSGKYVGKNREGKALTDLQKQRLSETRKNLFAEGKLKNTGGWTK